MSLGVLVEVGGRPAVILLDFFIFILQNLSLFGIDIVVEKGTKSHAVIDINYFPGLFSYFLFPTSESRSVNLAQQKQTNKHKQTNNYNYDSSSNI